MHNNGSHKIKQFFFVLIKLSIVVAAFYFIYTKIVENEHLEFNKFVVFLNKNEVFSLKNSLVLIILTGFNWFFEITKWQQLVKVIKGISFISALEQSLGGLTASLITPNRIGDYGAKAIYYTKPYRTKIVLLNLLGNMAQMIITTLLGCIGFTLFARQYAIAINYTNVITIGIIILIIGLFTGMILSKKHFKIKGFSLISVIDFIKSIPLKTHVLNLILSCARYLIFSFQFYFLLTVFNIDLNYYDAMLVITSMYLLASIVPTISIFDVVIKSSIAVFLFAYIPVNEFIILSITSLMWLLNFVLPSVFGSYFVLNFKLPKSLD